MLTDSVSAVEKLCLVKSDFFGNGSFVNELGAEEHELKEEWRTFGDTDDRGALTENGDASSPPASTWGRTSLTELFWLSSRSATKEGGPESLASEIDRRSVRLLFSVDVHPMVSSDGAPISFALDERRFGCACGAKIVWRLDEVFRLFFSALRIFFSSPTQHSGLWKCWRFV